jgi:heat shock protein HtpX
MPVAKRIFLFLLTNIAVLAVISVAFRVLGIGRLLDEQGIGLDYWNLLAYSAVIGFSGAFVSLLLSKYIAKKSTGAQVIERPRNDTERWLLEVVTRLAKQEGIGMPEVAIYPSPEINAFATGARRNAALVAVSAGLLQKMSREQAEAVLAHEVAHVANGDMVTLSLIQGVVNTFVVFLSRVVGHFVDRVVFRTERGHGPAFWIVSLLAQVLLGILATVIVMWFSRWREFRADHGAARRVGAGAMASALERLRAEHAPTVLPDSMRAFGIRPGEGRGFGRLFMSHPPIEERIARLQALR